MRTRKDFFILDTYVPCLNSISNPLCLSKLAKVLLSFPWVGRRLFLPACLHGLLEYSFHSSLMQKPLPGTIQARRKHPRTMEENNKRTNEIERTSASANVFPIAAARESLVAFFPRVTKIGRAGEGSGRGGYEVEWRWGGVFPFRALHISKLQIFFR